MGNADERSERLRRTRSRSKQKAQQTAEQSETSKPSKTSKTAKTSESLDTSESSGTDKPTPVKKLLTGTYMYLTDDLVTQIDSEFKRLRYELDDDLERELEKNRDFYNLLVAAGVDALQDADPESLAERVDERRRTLEENQDT